MCLSYLLFAYFVALHLSAFHSDIVCYIYIIYPSTCKSKCDSANDPGNERL